MSGIVQGLIASLKSAVAVTDAFFNRVTLLLNTGSTNGAQNNTFLDSSSNNFSITRNGNTTQGTFTPFSQTGWSNFLDGTDDYFTVPYNIAFAPASSDFTVEAWVYFASAPGATSAAIVGNLNQSTGNGDWSLFYRAGSTRFEFACSSSGLVAGLQRSYYSITPVAGTWYHVVGVKSGSTLSCYVNGVKGTDATLATVNNGSLTTYIGVGSDLTADVFGYISNLRIVKGTAVYSGSSFSVPTTPLTAITNTSFLSCQSNRFIDNSSNAFTITSAGTPSVQAFSPFAPTIPYSTSVVGGSGYFDGTGDYLTVASNAALQIGNVDWTIESWMYLTTLPSASGYQAIAQKGRGAASDYEYFVAVNNNAGNYRISVELSTTGSNVVGYNSSTITLRASSWNHFAVSKSGTTLYYFVNGVAAGTSTITSATGWFTGTGALGIGANNNGGAYLVFGYMSGTRITKSGALYTTAFTAPTAPPTTTVSAGTVSALLNFTNAGIFDSASKNVLETVGNAQVSTTQAKFGTTSIAFDGTGDYLLTRENQIQAFGTGDFTIEFWLNTSDLGAAADKALIDFRPSSTNGAYPYIYIYQSKVRYYFQTADRIVQASTLSTGVWYHIAICREGSSTRMFIDGTQTSSTYTNSDSCLIGTNRPVIGANSALSANFNGYIDDLRITRYARYTANFTAPTAAFGTQ